MLPRHARCGLSLVYAATDTVFCKAPVSLKLAESKILLAALADARFRTPLPSFCTVQLRTHCVARSLTIFSLCTTSGPGPGELPRFWGLMVFRHQPIPRKGRATTTTTAKLKLQTHYYVTKGVSKFRRPQSCKQNYVTICNLLSQDSISIYIHGTPLYIRNQYTEIRNKY